MGIGGVLFIVVCGGNDEGEGAGCWTDVCGGGFCAGGWVVAGG